MRRFLFIFFFVISIVCVFGQTQDKNKYQINDSLINEAMKAEDYLKAITLIEKQFLLIDSYELHDSLYKYCYNFGRAWWKIGGPDKGIDAAEQISEEVKEKDTKILHYLQTLNDLSWLYYETGNVNQCLVTDSIYLSICLENEGIPVDKLNIAYYNLGFDYLETGQYLRSLDHFQSSVDVILESGEKQDKNLSKSYNALGAVQWHLGMLDEAKKSYQESLALIENFSDPTSQLEKGNILGNLALILQDNGEIIEAKELQEQFIQIDSEALPLIEDAYMKETALRRMSSAYINLADIYFSLGDYEKSRKLVELAIEEREKILEPDDPSLAGAIEHLAYLEMQSGNLNEAERKLKEYLAYCQHFFGENSAKTAWAYKDMGILYFKKKEYKRSESFFSKAIQSQKKVGNPKGDPYLAKIYHERSILFAATNKTDEALADLEKSKQIWLHSHEKDNLYIVGLYLETAEIKIEEKDYIGAEHDVLFSLNLLTAKNNFPEQTTLYFPTAYYLKALIETKNNSDSVTLKQALNNLEISIKYLKTSKQGFLDEESKLKLYAAHKKIFELAEDIAYLLYDITNDDKWVETFFRLAEENRTILLRKQLQNFSALDYAGVPDTILQKERQLISRLRNENEDLKAMKNVVDLERQYNKLIQYIRENYPDYFTLKYLDRNFTINEVQLNLLNDDISLLLYSLTTDYVYVLLVEREDVQLLRLPKGDLRICIENLNQALISNNSNDVDSISTLLSESLFEPVRTLIKHKELLIVPDDELFFLNFEILPDLSKGENKFLIYDYTISYHLSTTVALQFRGLDEDKSGSLLAFAPGFTDRQKQNYKASVTDSLQLDNKFLTCIQQPFAVQTAKNIAGVFSGTSFLEDDADETTFKKESGKYGIIHLGTHAEINQKSPLMSHLVLSKNRHNDSIDDGYLHAYEIYQMPLKAELAVLTACETGVGKQQNSEGIISLAHSFSYAGCPSIVMSLWSIDEKTSASIINDFYHYLAKGMHKNTALRKAKLDYLEHATKELQFPYYWAGLVLLGDTSPVEIDTAFEWSKVIPLLIVIFVLLVFALLRRRKFN